jgi:hypothetical protein
MSPAELTEEGTMNDHMWAILLTFAGQHARYRLVEGLTEQDAKELTMPATRLKRYVVTVKPHFQQIEVLDTEPDAPPA